MIGQEADALIAHPHLVGISSPDNSAAPKPATISTPFTALMLIIAARQVSVELGVDRRPQSRRHAFGDHLDHRADRGTLLSDTVEIAFEDAALSLSGQKNGLRAISSQSISRDSILCGPICTSAPRTVIPSTIFRAMAPAATRIAVSRADERPPPR